MSETASYRAGLAGEMKAARYLHKKGLKICAFRYRTAGGEIDLVCRKGDLIIFTEVKNRPSGMPGDGIRAVDRKKQSRIRQAAKMYLAQKGLLTNPVRFDVVEMTKSGIWHIENAF